MSFPARIPFVESLGFEFVRWHAGEAEIAVTLREELCNAWSVVHGGVTMTLLDVVMAHAARSPGQAGITEARGVVTVEMKTTFMRPGVGRLVGKGTLLHRTASMAFCEGSVFDAAGVRIAHSTGTFKYLKGLPVGGRLIQRPDASD
ncbi:MAG TPA: PaaI family thioesterase [Caldimonas sp.]